ncbi:U1 zinc finger domain-containing protein [Lophiotrema nucula]|uniref:U1 zinc finger domain-containing protein n=1 Tax=Lophiotrema nucula TaxID=690887 RepID=A0A6A5ZNI9_9PLEO|nr:U1 zinc finger domain-containing protein [Lophiotrema nucula]
MSEYWKSTPKYWCKFCSAYVKDTKFERQQHEATGRHQGNIQRSLRGLTREKQQEERQQAAAKREVERLNGLVPKSSSSSAPSERAGAKPVTKEAEKPATLQDRRKQWEQLAAMGIAAPDQVRGDMAQAGEWQVVSEKLIGEDGKEIQVLNKGVRKRKVDEAEEELQAAGEMITKKKGWGNTYKSFPGKLGGGDDDVEVLFKKVKKTPAVKQEELEGKVESEVDTEITQAATKDTPTETAASKDGPNDDTNVKAEDEIAAPAVVFKKRKKPLK